MNASHTTKPRGVPPLPRRVDATTDRIVSVVEHDGLAIEVTVSFKDCRLCISVNGAILGQTTTPRQVVRAMMQGSTSSHEITAWFEVAEKPPIVTASSPMMRFGGVGIMVDGIPVENTLADSWVHIREGRPWLWVFVVSFCAKAVLAPRVNAEIGPALSVVYGAGAVLLGYLAITFKAKPQLGIHTGLILGVIDTLDSFAGLPARLSYGFSYRPIILIALRVWALISLWKARGHPTSPAR